MATQKKKFTYLSRKEGTLICSIQEHIDWVDSTEVDRDTIDNWELIWSLGRAWSRIMLQYEEIRCEGLYKLAMKKAFDDMLNSIWRLSKNQEGRSSLWCDADRNQEATTNLHRRTSGRCINEYFWGKLRIVVISPYLRGSVDLLPGWEGVREGTVFSMCHVLWPKLTVVSLVKELVGRMVDWISI